MSLRRIFSQRVDDGEESEEPSLGAEEEVEEDVARDGNGSDDADDEESLPGDEENVRSYKKMCGCQKKKFNLSQIRKISRSPETPSEEGRLQ